MKMDQRDARNSGDIPRNEETSAAQIRNYLRKD